MNLRLLFLPVVAVASGVIAVGAQRAARAAHRAREAADAEHHEVRTAIAAAEKHLAALAAEPVARPAGAPPPASATTLPRRSNPDAQIGADPRLLAAHSKDFRESLDIVYGPVIAAVGLTGARWERFKDLKVAFELRRLETSAAIEVNQLRPSTSELQAVAAKIRAEESAQESAVLGELAAPVRDFQRRYNSTQPIRTLVRRLASSEVSPEPPITAAQVEQLTDIIARYGTSAGGTTTREGIDWERATSELGRVVSGTCVTVLREIFDQMQLVQRSQQELNRVRAAAQPIPASP